MTKSEKTHSASRRRERAAGILPSQTIAGMIADREIGIAEPVIEGQVQPASLDLRLGAVAYRVRASFLPRPGGRVQGNLDDLALHTISLSQGAVLEAGCV
ncbi:MAG: 2'-deoxycytidine 5'-triphosphate deaminase, partial [Hyphomicrobium sp.]|nr:2'-deoxycytidine 5'-triphosphate deaminase [Hyphomicrobium sp.]